MQQNVMAQQGFFATRTDVEDINWLPYFELARSVIQLAGRENDLPFLMGKDANETLARFWFSFFGLEPMTCAQAVYYCAIQSDDNRVARRVEDRTMKRHGGKVKETPEETLAKMQGMAHKITNAMAEGASKRQLELMRKKYRNMKLRYESRVNGLETSYEARGRKRA